MNEPTMEQFGKNEFEQAQKLSEFFIDLVENHLSTVKYYLADNVVLDWFGKTIKSERKVSSYLKDSLGRITHHITRTVPAESVAFRDVHRVQMSKVSRPPAIIPLSPTDDRDPLITPPKQQVQASTSMLEEIGQGDGFHNNNDGDMSSPMKKPKLSITADEVAAQEKKLEHTTTETVEGEQDSANIKYVTAEGEVEFRRPSFKKLQTETKWRRPCKLHIGYTGTSHRDCTIYLIIYEGNVKCRRNLYKDFCESENGDND